MKIEEIAEEIGYVWIDDGGVFLYDTSRGGGEVYFSTRDAATKFIRDELSSSKGNAVKERKRRLARIHSSDDEFIKVLDSYITTKKED